MGVEQGQLKGQITEAAERMGMDYEDLAEMIPEVLDDCLVKADKLIGEVDAGNAAQVKAIAHDLKGSCGNYGLVSPSALAKSLEMNHESPDKAELEQFIAEIKQIKAMSL